MLYFIMSESALLHRVKCEFKSHLIYRVLSVVAVVLELRGRDLFQG